MRILGLDIRRARDLSATEEEPQLRTRVQRLEMALRELDEQLSALESHHLALRNKVHGKHGRAGKPKDDESVIDFGDKRALREHARQRGLLP